MLKLEQRNKIPKTREEMAEIRRKNKDRSKAMEREITKKLNGKRTPQSGAGMIKGDGIVYLPDNQGLCVIECKVTSAIHKLHGPRVAFKMEWLTKLESDTRAMRSLGSRFGALVVKFHNTSRVYTFINVEYLDVIERTLEISIMRDNDMQLDITTWANGNEKKIIQIMEKDLATLVHGTIETLHGTFYVLTFKEFCTWFAVKDESTNE